MEKLNLTQQKHALTNQKKCTTTKNKHKRTKARFSPFYDNQPGNGAGLFSKEKISKGVDMHGKSEQKRIRGEANDVKKQTINIVPKINK